MDMTKYKFYHYTGKPDVDGGKQTVCAQSTYAGKTVKGYAKCDPRDSFDLEAGKKLAAARCNARIAEKRHARAQRKYSEAMDQLARAQDHALRMLNYMKDAADAMDTATEVEKMLTTSM